MSFLNEISNDIDWRMGELASLKTIPLRYNMLSHHQNILTTFAVPSFYAIWEGFIRHSFELYIRELNSMAMEVNQCHINILTHALSSIDKLKLENSRIRFSSKKEFIECYQEKIENALYIPPGLPTKSNVDFKVTNDILERFNLNSLPLSYESGLKKLLRFRNSIAHGENSIPVTIENLNEFSTLITDLMLEIFTSIENGVNNSSFRK